MKVSLPFGDGAIEANVPDDALVLVPQHTPPLDDPVEELRDALERSVAGRNLRSHVRFARSAAIVVSDVTRPVPNRVILPPMLETLAVKIRPEDTTIIIATGLHRPSRPDERERILGREIVERYRVIDHDARHPMAQRYFTRTSRGVPVYVNREYLDADLRVLTGFVEPHLFAGYSGGGKAMLPGICGANAIMGNHDAAMISHPKATWCTTDGNPIFEEMREIAVRTKPAFIVNVTLDEQKRITGIFAGDLVAAHDAAIAQAERQAVREIPHLFDIVVTTNMGYPADLVLYQSVKGMSVAAQACAAGGAILLVAECREGIGAPEYAETLRSEASPEALMRRIMHARETTFDQWQVQVQAMVQARCEVWLHSALSREETESVHLRYAADVDATLAELIETKRRELRREPTICVLPHGQLTVPRLAA